MFFDKKKGKAKKKKKKLNIWLNVTNLRENIEKQQPGPEAANDAMKLRTSFKVSFEFSFVKKRSFVA